MSGSRQGEGRPTPETGTVEYAAPEQMKSGVRHTEKVDVFAFGMVAYEIMKGSAAPRGEGSSVLVDPPAWFGSLMQNLIRRCWSAKPDERPAFEEIFNEFKSARWEILPNADAKLIGASALRVVRFEKGLG
jgi:serine/threonine protein kinase